MPCLVPQIALLKQSVPFDATILYQSPLTSSCKKAMISSYDLELFSTAANSSFFFISSCFAYKSLSYLTSASYFSFDFATASSCFKISSFIEVTFLVLASVFPPEIIVFLCQIFPVYQPAY